MRPGSSRRLLGGARWLVFIVLVGVAAVMGLGALLVSQGIPVPILDRWLSEARLARERIGKTPVPLSAVAIPAYTQLTRDHFWDARNNRLAVAYLDKQQVGDVIITRFDQLIGRVLDHDKPAGYVFTESDLLPPGTRPGLVAGIPPGMRAIRIDAGKIQGVHGLKRGDRFDLVATIPIDAKAVTGPALKGIFAPQLDMQARLSNAQKQATVRVIVQNGTVVSPLTNRLVPVSTRTLTQGQVTQTRPVQEVVIAVSPDEVARFTEALAVGAEITCVPRSGSPDDPPDSFTPNRSPHTPFTEEAGVPSSMSVVETISGTQRALSAVPQRK